MNDNIDKSRRKEKHFGKFWRANDGGEVEQRGAASNRAKGGIEHVREDGRSQLPRTTSGRWRWMGTRSWTGAGRFECVRSTGCNIIGCRKPAVAASQPSARLATWCIAAVSAVARMMGSKGKAE